MTGFFFLCTPFNRISWYIISIICDFLKAQLDGCMFFSLLHSCPGEGGNAVSSFSVWLSGGGRKLVLRIWGQVLGSWPEPYLCSLVVLASKLGHPWLLHPDAYFLVTSDFCWRIYRGDQGYIQEVVCGDFDLVLTIRNTKKYKRQIL